MAVLVSSRGTVSLYKAAARAGVLSIAQSQSEETAHTLKAVQPISSIGICI